MGTPRPRALSAVPEVQDNAEISPIFGSNDTQGVTGVDFKWGARDSVSFAILNQTESPVKDIHFLVVFFAGDKGNGFRAIDYVESKTCPGEIFRPNLPKRQDEFYSQILKFGRPCDYLEPSLGVASQTGKVEIRVLDFKLAK